MNGPEIIRTRDGKKLAVTVYRPQIENSSLVVMGASAFATQRLYTGLASFLARHQYTVITFDYRGAGASVDGSMRNNRARLRQWARLDLDAVLLHAKKWFPDKELIFLGHGISGEIIGLPAASQYINRLVLINAAHTCVALWPWHGRLKKSAIKCIIPLFTFIFGYFPAIKFFSVPALPRGVITEWADWCNRRNGMFDVFPDTNYRKMQAPVLAFSFEDDWNAPAKAVASLHNHLSSALVTWRHIIPSSYGFGRVGHSGFFNKNNSDPLWWDLLNWLNDRPI